MKKEFDLKLLNNTQKEEAEEMLKFYKYVYICNSCGTVYGSDKEEKYKRCPKCELVNLKKNREDKD